GCKTSGFAYQVLLDVQPCVGSAPGGCRKTEPAQIHVPGLTKEVYVGCTTRDLRWEPATRAACARAALCLGGLRFFRERDQRSGVLLDHVLVDHDLVDGLTGRVVHDV